MAAGLVVLRVPLVLPQLAKPRVGRIVSIPAFGKKTYCVLLFFISAIFLVIPVGIAGRAPRPRVLAGGGAERQRGVLNFPLELHGVQGQVDGGVNPLEETKGGGGEGEEEKERAKVEFSRKHGSVVFLPNFSVQMSRKMRALPQKFVPFFE